MSVNILWSGRAGGLNDPCPRLSFSIRFLNDDHLALSRFAMVAQAVFLNSLLLGRGAYVIITIYLHFPAAAGRVGDTCPGSYDRSQACPGKVAA